jgi:Leucine Rich repeat
MILQPSGGAVLRTLLLSYNDVGNAGAIALAAVISANRPLARLSLKVGSRYTPRRTACMHCDVLTCLTPHLSSALGTTTHVQNNNVREDGLVALGLALPHNTHLQSLSLFGNDFSHRTGEVGSQHILPHVLLASS